MPDVMKRRYFSLAEKKALIDGYLKSPLGLKAYVSAHGIGLSSLTKWAKHFSVSLSKGKRIYKAVDHVNSPHNQNSNKPASQEMPLFVDVTASLRDQGFTFSEQKPSALKKAAASARSTNPETNTLNKLPSLSLKICFAKGMTMTLEGLAEDQAFRFIKGVL